MKKNKTFLIYITPLILIVLLGASCSSSSILTNSNKNQSKNISSFSTIKTGNISELTVAKNYIIKNNGDWKKMWEKINTNFSDMEIIDFDNEMVVVVAAGEQTSNDYTIEITDLIDYPNEVIIYYRTLDYGMNDKEGTFEPFHAIKTDKTDKKISFIKL